MCMKTYQNHMSVTKATSLYPLNLSFLVSAYYKKMSKLEI